MADRDYTIVAPDGRELTITGPDNATPQQLRAAAEKAFASAPPKPSFAGKVKQQAGNVIAGAVRGAGSIGATLLAPIDMASDALAGKGLSLESNRQRRADMDSALSNLGADTNSLAFKGGKIAGEIAGTAGAGGVVANALTRVAPAAAGAAPSVIEAIRTSGMGGGNMLTRMLGGAVAGGASAGLVDPGQAAGGAAVGGLLPPVLKGAGMAGSLAASGVKSAGRAVVGAVPDEVRALAIRAKELGIDIPADRLVSSKPMDAVASALNYVPFSGRAATEERMSSQLNRALSRTFGQDSSNVTQALRKAEETLGGQFDAFLKSNTVKVDQQFIADLAESSNLAARELGSDGASIIAKQVDDIIAKAGSGQIEGQAAYNIKKTLDRIGNRNSPEAWYAIDLKKRLMEALNRSVGPDQAQAFGQLRQQYGNMLDLQKLAKNGAEGEISVARLANMKNINNEPMQELADIAAQFVKAREGQHGAMQRAVIGGATAATGGLAGLAGGAAAGRAANMTLNSNALRNALMGVESPPNALTQLLTSDAARQLGYRVAPPALASR